MVRTTRDDVFLVVTGDDPERVVSFRSGERELARMTGPFVSEVLAWILAAITNPFTTVLRRNLS